MSWINRDRSCKEEMLSDTLRPAKMFTIAGPVIAFGTYASVLYGLILCLLG